ncbi:hypothetical protein BKA65DRAFT_511676 [Rhexocercosporidium sp. MPI-PUGE-AT-0058]|nr:hypothetical protein BKA65DRAFT_511676 [Rhexocercosporidium sp. MPI-PUGE-AT-0058]
MTTRSGRRLREATPENAEPVAEDVPAVVLHPIWVAIYEGDGVFKHWSLFVEDENNEQESFVVQVQGSAGRFRYEQKKKNPFASRSLIETIKVSHVQEANLRNLRKVAREVKVKNEDLTWNCQDFVWVALEAIASAGLIDAEDDLYISGRQTVWSRMEGLA